MMRYALALLIAVVTLSGGLIAQPDTTVVTGTLYGPNMRPLPGVEFKVIRIVKSGYVYTWGPATYRSNSSGVVSFPVPRNSTAYVYCEKIPLIDKDQRNGHAVTIPNTATATLQSILPAATVPANYIVAVPGAGISVEEDSVQVADTVSTINFVGSVSVTEYPSGTVTVNVSGGTGDTTGTTNQPAFGRFENMLGQFTASTSDSIKLAYDKLGDRADADSVLRKVDTVGLFIQKLLTPIVDYVSYNPLTTVAYQEGRVYYDSDDRALSYYTDNPDVTMNIGQEMWIRVRNTSGDTIHNGQVVYVNGATGQVPTVALAIADTLNGHGAQSIGVATHDILNNAFGYVTVHGIVRGLNTSDYGEGSSIYLSPDTLGKFSVTRPPYPIEQIHIGTVTYSHNNNGSILVSMHHSHGRYALADSLWKLWGSAFMKADTNALHAQKFADINTSLSSKLQWSDTTGFFARYGGVTSESDPTASGKIADSLANLANALSWEILPSAIRPTGTLGQALKMLPGGVVGWAADSAGGGALTNWDESDTSATQASRTLKPKAFTANVNAVIRPLGTGAFVVGPPPDGTSTGGNARGANAIDIQTSRTAAAQVASGSGSVAIGNSSTASNTNSVAVQGGSSTGIGAVAIRNNSVASGTTSTAIGPHDGLSTASGRNSLAVSGYYQTASGENAVTLSGRATAAMDNEFALGHYTYNLSSGIKQYSNIRLQTRTTGAEVDTLSISAFDGPGRTWSSKTIAIVLDSGQVMSYDIMVIGKSSVGDVASYRITGTIKRIGAPTSMVGTPTITTVAEDAAVSGADAGVIADDTNDALLITVTGVANKDFRWFAIVQAALLGAGSL